eukprot:scaffold37999_cov60-Phaeocystis_antarctica.AAC.5
MKLGVNSAQLANWAPRTSQPHPQPQPLVNPSALGTLFDTATPTGGETVATRYSCTTVRYFTSTTQGWQRRT